MRFFAQDRKKCRAINAVPVAPEVSGFGEHRIGALFYGVQCGAVCWLGDFVLVVVVDF